MVIDLKKKYRTRGGDPVTLVTDQGAPTAPIIGYVGTSEIPSVWTREGLNPMGGVAHSRDLVEDKAPFTFEKWLVIATEQFGSIKRGDILFAASDERRAKEELYRYHSTGHVKCAIQRVTLNVTEGEIDA